MTKEPISECHIYTLWFDNTPNIVPGGLLGVLYETLQYKDADVSRMHISSDLSPNIEVFCFAFPECWSSFAYFGESSGRNWPAMKRS